MFILSEIEDKIRVDPADLGRPTSEAVTSVIERLYIDKVVSDLGLVITIYDILGIEGGFIYTGDGAAQYTVKFRLAVFRPFLGEVLVGRLVKSDRSGLHISLEFFEDLFVPEHYLPEPSVYDEAEGLWYWNFEGNQMYMELEDQIRLRVTDVKFHKAPTVADLRSAKEADGDLLGTAANPFAPMQVIGCANEDGCGVLSWWEQAEPADAMEA